MLTAHGSHRGWEEGLLVLLFLGDQQARMVSRFPYPYPGEGKIRMENGGGWGGAWRGKPVLYSCSSTLPAAGLWRGPAATRAGARRVPGARAPPTLQPRRRAAAARGGRRRPGPAPVRPRRVRPQQPSEATAARRERRLAGAGAPWEAPEPREWAPLSPRAWVRGAARTRRRLLLHVAVPGRAERLGTGSPWLPGSSTSFHGAGARPIRAPTEGTCVARLSEVAPRAREFQ